MSKLSFVVVAILALAGCLGRRHDGGAGELYPGPDMTCAGTSGPVSLDVPYATIAGVDPSLLRLDVYRATRPAGCGSAPVVVWVHGGAWAIGDKANRMEDKIPLFNAAGWTVVSVNYRLSPDTPSTDPTRVMYPMHPRDVASAVHWVRRHAGELDIDTARLALIGHSAGAHLVALVSTDAQFLAVNGDALSDIRCTGSYDTEAYDIPSTLANASPMQRQILENAFGVDPAIQRAASPLSHVKAGIGIPSFQVVVRGGAAREATELGFAAALNEAGIEATTIDASSLSHEEVNEHIGQSGDTVMTAPVMAFLSGCLEP